MSPKRAGNILVVEDELGVRSILKEYLSIEGYRVEVAENGEEALMKLDKFLPDCILLDIRMPYLNGVEALKMIKFRLPRVQVIMTTAVTRDSTMRECMENGAFAYIHKPIDLDLLSIKIWEALENSHSQIQAKEEAAESEVRAIIPEMPPVSVDKPVNSIRRENGNSKEEGGRDYKTQIRFLGQELYDTLKLSLGLFEFSNTAFVHHAKNVSWLALQIGSEMGFQQTRLLEMAGLFHDVGKLRLPDRLQLASYSSLTEIEKKVFEKYPVWGQDFLRQYTHLHNAGEAVRSHMENLEGTGFPDQLAGEEIPLASRILRVANDFDEAVNREAPRNLEVDLGKQDVGTLLETMRSRIGELYDRQVVGCLEVVVHKCLDNPKREIEIGLHDLKPTQILSRDLMTESGRPVQSRNTILTSTKIHQIRELNEVDLVCQPVFIYHIA